MQGLGADILRFVLRRLDRELAHIGAFVVHQAHDEIVIAYPAEHELEARDILVDTMTTDVAVNTTLLPLGINLHVKQPKTGTNWGELL